MPTERSQAADSTHASKGVARLRARLALVRSLVDELERHMNPERGPLEIEWLCPLAAQLAEEAAGLAHLGHGLPESERDPVVQ